MKIRIIKADKTKWYSDRIGRVYVVKGIHELAGNSCFVIRNYRTILRTIAYNDAEIVNELHDSVENLKTEIFKAMALEKIAKWLKTFIK